MDSINPDVIVFKAIQAIERKVRLRRIMIFAPGASGALLASILPLLSDEQYSRGLNIPIAALAAGFLTVAAFAAAYTYLQSGFRSISERDISLEIDRLDAKSETRKLDEDVAVEIATLRSEVERLKSQPHPTDRDSESLIVETLKTKLEDNYSDDLAKEIQRLVDGRNSASSKTLKIHESFDDCRRRLLMEIDSLGRRGNLNLGVGVATTLLGLTVLGITVFVYQPYKATDLVDLVSHYLPRLSLIILIEVFAYFFLSLYKAGLAEIKYFQNELTNIEAKQIAMQASLDAADNSMLSVVVTQLSTTERNHILTKDQTTVELEKAKLESESKVAFGRFVTDFFQKVKPSS